MTEERSSPEPAYLRWRKDGWIAVTLVMASLSLTTGTIAILLGLSLGRGTWLYAAALLANAILAGLIMTHNRVIIPISKPLVLVFGGACLAFSASHTSHGQGSLGCAVSSAIFAALYVAMARGERWHAFAQDVRTGEDTPRAAVRSMRAKTDLGED